MRLRFRPSFFSLRRNASAASPARRGFFWRLQAKRGALVLGCFILLSGTAFAAVQWRRVGTVSGTLTPNHLCKNDGLDIICDTTTPYVDSSGNVGIGTTGPGGKLDIVRANDNGTILRIGTIDGYGYNFARNSGTGYLEFNGNQGSIFTGYVFQNNGSELMRIAASGNVGIGTTSPATRLDVSGAASLRLGTDLTTTGSQNDVAISAYSSLRYAGTAAATFTGLASGANGRVLYLHNASSYTLTVSNQSASSTAANRIITGTGADLSVPTNTSVTLQYDSTDSRWRVTGSSNSANTLAAGTTGQVQFNGGTNLAADSNLTWDNTNKRLGIGTNAPSNVLHVNGTLDGSGSNNSIFAVTSTGTGAGTILSASENSQVAVVTLAASSVIARNNGSGTLDITKSGGQIRGISGNQLNLQPLNMIGNTLSFATGASSGVSSTTAVYIDSSGNVGIGTTSPAFALDVGTGTSATARFYDQTATIGTTKVVIRAGAGQANANLQEWQNNSGTMQMRAGDLGSGNWGFESPKFFTSYSTLTYLSASILAYNRASAGTAMSLQNSASSVTLTSGTLNAVNIWGTGSSGFLPTSGTGVLNLLTINSNNVINQTGGASGITRGLYIDPTLTAAADWRSIETSNNSGYAIYTAGSANSYFGGNVGIGTATPAAEMKADINGAVKVAGSGSETCSASTYGAMRYNAAGGYFEICSP